MSNTATKAAPKSTVKKTSKDKALKASKAAKKAPTVNKANVEAMKAIAALVDSGCDQVTAKVNKTGSVMWVKILKREELDALGKAVISNIQKATKTFGKNASCNSFTLASSGYKCLHIHG